MMIKRILAFLLATVLIAGNAFVEVGSESGIKLIIDGQEKSLTEEIFVSEDGTVYVPLVETFAHLGVGITENNNTYTGNGNNGEIIIKVGENTAEVDWVDIELPAPVIERNGTAMIPAYLIEDAVKTEAAVYDEAAGTLSVISPDPSDTYEEVFDIGKIMETLPEGDVIMSQSDLYGSNAYGEAGWQHLGITKNVSVDVDGYTDALQLETMEFPYGEVPAISDVAYRLNAVGKQDMKKGDVAILHFKARATKTSDESGTANLIVNYERNSDWNKMGVAQWAVSRDNWQDYYLPLYATEMGTNYDAEWPADKSHIKFCVGGKPQTIQIAGFELIYYGSDKVDIADLRPGSHEAYHGVGEDALWRKEAYRRVEKYRKEDVSVTVRDESGNPVSGAEIEVNQAESDFIFGVAICNDELLNLDTSTVGGKIQNETLDSFNMGVCGLEMKSRQINEDGGALGIEMTNEFFRRGKRMKGHTLMWDSDWLLDFISETGNRRDLSYEEIYRRVYDYVMPIAYMFRGKMAQWDVLNEPHDSNFIRTTYGTRLYADIFKAVHEIDPDAKLYVNETGIEGKNQGMSDRIPALLDIVRGMQNEGAPIDGIGLQAHCINYNYPQGLYHQLDECAQIVDEVAITEYDFYNENMEYADEHLRDSLLATFSHPKSSAFIMWGYWDYAHWRKCAPFYDTDWNEKPAKAVWDKMVKEEFKTKLSLTTGADGKADFRGFHGDYEITVKYDGKEEKFNFGLKNDSENYINVTIGGSIFAATSSGKYIDIPSPIEYETLEDSNPEYREDCNPPYISLLIESNLRGVAADTLVSEGGDLSLDSDYTNGKKWGSQSGMSAVTTDSADGIIFNNSTSGSFTMSHKYSGNVFDKGNLEMSFKVDTFASQQDGFSLDMAFMKDDSTVSVGKIKTGADGYCLETLSGDKINLSDNTTYDIYVTLAKTAYPSVYDVKYVIEQNGTVIAEETATQGDITALTWVTGIAVTAECTGAENSDVLKIKYARVKYYTTDLILEFSPINLTAELVNETMRKFDVGNVVSEDNSMYLSGDAWGSNTADLENAFLYQGCKYLFGVRNAPSGEQQLKKKMGTLRDGETLDVEFDYYINAPYGWFNSEGYFDIRLESADQSVNRSLVKHEYSRKDYGFRVNFLSDSENSYALTETVDWGDVSKHNRNNLHIKCRIEENENGGYDATINIKNASNVETNAFLENILTKEEFLKLDTFVIANQTLAEGASYGETIAGIRNIVVTKSGRDAYESGDMAMFSNGDFGGIGFRNLTQKPFDAMMLLGGYKDGSLVSVSVENFKDRDEKDGFLSMCLDNAASDADSYKVILVENPENMRPFKEAENIEISNFD